MHLSYLIPVFIQYKRMEMSRANRLLYISRDPDESAVRLRLRPTWMEASAK